MIRYGAENTWENGTCVTFPISVSIDCYLTSMFLNAKFLTHENSWKIIKDGKNLNHVQMNLDVANVRVFSSCFVDFFLLFFWRVVSLNIEKLSERVKFCLTWEESYFFCVKLFLSFFKSKVILWGKRNSNADLSPAISQHSWILTSFVCFLVVENFSFPVQDEPLSFDRD